MNFEIIVSCYSPYFADIIVTCSSSYTLHDFFSPISMNVLC